MADWLLKSEPDVYSYDDLAREKKCVWDGVANNLALVHMRQMKTGDRAFIYHTGDEKAVAGIAEVTRPAYPDPNEDEARLIVIDLKPLKKLARPVTLKEIKADPAFKEWALVTNSRLSAMPVPAAVWKRIEHLSETPK